MQLSEKDIAVLQALSRHPTGLTGAELKSSIGISNATLRTLDQAGLIEPAEHEDRVKWMITAVGTAALLLRE